MTVDELSDKASHSNCKLYKTIYFQGAFINMNLAVNVRTVWYKISCYIAGVFPATVCPLIG